jgi:hypothetical protein
MCRYAPLFCAVDVSLRAVLLRNYVMNYLFVRFSLVFILNYALQHFKAYCAIWIRRSKASPRMSPRESAQRCGRRNYGREMSGNFA